MLRALTHKVSPRIAECEVTFIDRSPIDLRLAVLQHDHYCDVLKGLGVTVKKLSENGSYPDSCFVEDTAIVVDKLAIICSMGVSSRRRSEEHTSELQSQSNLVCRLLLEK